MSGHHKPLPAAELITAAQQGNKSAMNSLIAASMWIVTAQVRRWAAQMPDEDVADLQQIALCGSATSGKKFGGLLRAIETYDAQKGNNFWTHCTTWVKAELGRAHATRQKELKAMGGVTIDVETHDYDTANVDRADNRYGRPVQLPSSDNPETAAAARMQLAKLSRIPPEMRQALAMRAGELQFVRMGEELGISREYARKVYRRAVSLARVAMKGPRAA